MPGVFPGTAHLRDSRLLLGLGLVLCAGGALALILDRRPSSIPAARPTSYVFAQEGWLQPTPLPSITNSDVTLHWTPYPAARWYDVTVLTEDLSVVHRAFISTPDCTLSDAQVTCRSWNLGFLTIGFA